MERGHLEAAWVLKWQKGGRGREESGRESRRWKERWAKVKYLKEEGSVCDKQSLISLLISQLPQETVCFHSWLLGQSLSVQPFDPTFLFDLERDKDRDRYTHTKTHYSKQLDKAQEGSSLTQTHKQFQTIIYCWNLLKLRRSELLWKWGNDNGEREKMYNTAILHLQYSTYFYWKVEVNHLKHSRITIVYSSAFNTRYYLFW